MGVSLYATNSKTRIFDYKIDSVNSVASAVVFLLNMRMNNNVFIKHIDLDDDLRNSEGSMSTVLDGNISEKNLIEEIIKRNVDKVTMFTKIFDETVLFRVNFHTWNVSVSLNINSKIDIEDLENIFLRRYGL